ncbi:MAG: alpha/beta hydrolase [Nanoarchaeota archaeon]|nr:alpha/beta hydrolase [Nanoarchaeota archaeon]
MIKENFAISKDGIKIFYKYYNSNKNHFVLVITNLLGYNTSVMKDLFCFFVKKNCSILVYDLRNHGRSDSGKISIKGMVNDLKSILDQENIKKVILLGLSLSGKIPLYFYYRYPNYVKSIFLSNFPTKGFLTRRSKILFLCMKLFIALNIKRSLKQHNQFDYSKSKKIQFFIPKWLWIIQKEMSLTDFFKMAVYLIGLKANLGVIKVPTIIYVFRKEYYVKNDYIFNINNPYIKLVTTNTRHFEKIRFSKNETFTKRLYTMYLGTLEM